ncbi:2-hydroxy-6-oxo-2,4-heptadienoate hydrolase [Acinetobacter sp. ANC 4654]|uniref:alpha/beta fold hydrolase n=1 Tax=Acinetobacter sp. ANC 4654 TaxID=1977872 RepID=UPI000A342D02|nr:alpha/beta hydrolase [Acinetobacter sp. ANC 4654]OTG92472.1 2-hydroxy-6-oxo-2,4-heptadienoate hydrolase [Acinetobacter sp. ANC 4654]
MNTMINNPEIGKNIQCGDIVTNYHDVGNGEPILLLHGSGPGVSAWANWRLTIQSLQDQYRLIAPDLAGFGYSQFPENMQFSRKNWLKQIVDFLDAMGLEKVNVIGNSFGGSMALALAIHHPERVNKLVLMGSVGVPFELTKGLDAVWGYTPSFENMQAIMKIFAYNQKLVGDELVQMRYIASTKEDTRAAYERMFPAPRQRWVEAMSHPEVDIRSIQHPTLMVHGRDDQVIPLSTSLTMLNWIENSQLHIYSQCGHWTQIEHAKSFTQLVANFLKDQ